TARCTTAKHLHLVRADFGGVAVLTGLVLPFARLDAAFDVDRTALAQVLRGDFGEPVEHHDAVPLGALLALARSLVLPVFGRCDAQVADRAARRGVAGF